MGSSKKKNKKEKIEGVAERAHNHAMPLMLSKWLTSIESLRKHVTHGIIKTVENILLAETCVCLERQPSNLPNKISGQKSEYFSL